MADVTNDNRMQSGAEEKIVRRGHRLLNGILLLLVLLLVLAIVIVAAYRDGTGFDALRRYFSYGSAESGGGSMNFQFDADTRNRFAAIGDDLVVLSGTSLQLLEKDGTEKWSANVQMSAPALASGGERAVAYDVGGRQLYLLDGSGLLMELAAGEQDRFIAATVNRAGMLAVTREDENYKGSVEVYDETQSLVFAFHSSRRFVLDARVTEDGQYLAAVTLGQEGGGFVSDVVLYDLSKTDPAAEYTIPDHLVAAIGEQEGNLITVADTALTAASVEGTVVGTYAYPNEYLREYALDGDGFAALLLNRYASGSVGRIVTVGADAKEIASVDVEDEVLSLSAKGRYLAVLFGDRLVIYNRSLQPYATLRGTDYIREALMRADGSALLLTSESGELFLP